MSDTPSDQAAPNDSVRENVVSLSRFRARQERDVRQKTLDTLLDARDPEVAVRALSGETLYELLRDVDPREHLDVLVHARAEQIQTIFDLAAWSGDRLSPDRLWPWLATLAAAPSDVLSRWLSGLDVELVALLLRKGSRIYDLEIEPPPDDPQGTFLSTPDGFFVLDVTGYESVAPGGDAGETDPTIQAAIEAGEVAAPPGPGESPSAEALIRIVENLYRGNLDFARRILVGAKAELDSELEEMAYRWRQGRMQDLGFEDAATARAIYRPIDPTSVHIGELRPGTRVRPIGHKDSGADGVHVPLALAAEMDGPSLFAAARARIASADEREELDTALFTLTNRVLAAAGVDLGDELGAASHVARMRGTLDLGVDYLARRGGVFDEDRAVDAVRTVAVERLFRVGVALMAKARKLATELRKSAPFVGPRADLDLLEEPEASALAAALRPHPLFPRVLDDPAGDGERPIATLMDLARLTAAIERAAAAQILLLGLGVTVAAVDEALAGDVEPTDRAAIDTAVLARTALVLSLLQRSQVAATKASAPTKPTPEGLRALTSLEVRRFGKLYAQSPEAERELRANLEALAPESMLRAAREVTARWLATLNPLEPVLVRPSRRPARTAPPR